MITAAYCILSFVVSIYWLSYFKPEIFSLWKKKMHFWQRHILLCIHVFSLQIGHTRFYSSFTLRAMLHSASTNFMHIIIIMHHFTSLSAGMLAPKNRKWWKLIYKSKGLKQQKRKKEGNFEFNFLSFFCIWSFKNYLLWDGETNYYVPLWNFPWYSCRVGSQVHDRHIDRSWWPVWRRVNSKRKIC